MRADKTMLGLKLPTDKAWINRVLEGNLAGLLTDHAWCEQKAASNAITLIVSYPEHTGLVAEMCLLAQEEMGHFKQVHEIIIARGYTLGRERKDSYVNELSRFIRKGYADKRLVFTDRMLFAAMIEARSCERFKIVAENIDDPELAAFYHELMISEASHYTTFLRLAKKYGGGADVDERWHELLDYEAGVIKNYGKNGGVHG